MATKIETGRPTAYRAAALHDEGKDPAELASVAKYSRGEIYEDVCFGGNISRKRVHSGVPRREILWQSESSKDCREN